MEFNPKRNVVVERFEFQSNKQRKGETIDQYYIRLKIAATYCELQNGEDEIAGHIIQSCLRDKLGRQLLQLDKLTIKEMLSRGKSFDVVETLVKTLERAQVEEKVNAIMS